MNKEKNQKRITIDNVLVDIIKSGLMKRNSEVESLALTLARLVKSENPILSKQISHLVSSYSLDSSFSRSSPLPVDNDTQLDMVTIISPDQDLVYEPILHEIIKGRIDTFLEERSSIDLLLDKGIRPSTSMLLIGRPGTGKTMLARHVATALNKDLIILDLSASISSLLGKTGQNLKKVLQYAKQSSSVLLLDEFDAIAKRRDDSTDLGEIKRIVNVLLMELDSWPVSSVVMATSNHPELLDRAIWRRFDHVLELGLPERLERQRMLDRGFEGFVDAGVELIMPALAELLENKSGADLRRFTENVKRRVVLKKETALVACMHELTQFTEDKKAKGKFCRVAKSVLGDRITVRELAAITGLSVSGVQHHVSK